MPYPGGSAMQSGAAYQNWYLALLISYAYLEPDFIIYPEALRSKTVVVDDINVKSRLGKTVYSAKFRSSSKRLHWDQSNLYSQGIFKEFKNQHSVDSSCKIVLVSESNCYLFSEVFMRARNAELPNQIYDVLQSDFAIEQWEEAKQYLGYNDFQLIEFAKKVEIRCLPLVEIQNLLKHRFVSVGHHNAVKNLFFNKACESSSNKTKIDKKAIINWFYEEMIEFNN